MRATPYDHASRLRVRPVVVSAALVGAGGLIATAGAAVAALTGASAVRHWMREHKQHPGLAKVKWRQGRATAVAAADAWRGFSSSSAAGAGQSRATGRRGSELSG